MEDTCGELGSTLVSDDVLQIELFGIVYCVNSVVDQFWLINGDVNLLATDFFFKF